MQLSTSRKPWRNGRGYFNSKNRASEKPGAVQNIRVLRDGCYLRLKENNDECLGSIGSSRNLAVNELTNVLHTFYINVVQEE
jgi:hypothetical protein